MPARQTFNLDGNFAILLNVLIIFLCMAKPTQSETFIRNPVYGRCEDIEVPLCQGLEYNQTLFPNILGHETQERAGRAIEEVYPLLKLGCSAELKSFLCMVYIPRCNLIDRPIPVCKEFCQKAKSECEDAMKYGFKWPEDLECENLASFSPSEICLESASDSRFHYPDVVYESSTGSSEVPTCRPHEFVCGDGTCLDPRRRCDGWRDCKDGSDENQCPVAPISKCPETQFQCNTGNCIDLSGRCDGSHDCPDGSDELDCPCQDGEFQCADGLCILSSFVCDGQAYCEDGSDEINCAPTCRPHEFVCGDGTCLNPRRRCDGWRDCNDGTDEYQCPTESETSPAVGVEDKDLSPRKVPEEKLNVYTTDVQPDSVAIGWDDNPQDVSIIVGYTISVRVLGARQSMDHKVEAPKNYYHIQNLKPETLYYIQVIPSSKAGDGRPSNPVEVTTPPFVPILRTTPQEPLNVYTTDVQPDSVTIGWDDNPQDLSIIDSYIISVRVLGARQSMTHTIKAPKNNYHIQNLKPETLYYIQVRPLSIAGEGPRSKSLEVTTPPYDIIPTSPPDTIFPVREETARLFMKPFMRWLNSSTELNVAQVRLAQEQVEVAKLTRQKLNMELRQMKKATGGKKQSKSSKRKKRAMAKEAPEGIRKKQEEVQAPQKKTAEATKPPKGVRKKSRNIKRKPRTKTDSKVD